jgi:hypothetical protein
LLATMAQGAAVLTFKVGGNAAAEAVVVHGKLSGLFVCVWLACCPQWRRFCSCPFRTRARLMADLMRGGLLQLSPR